MAKIIIKEKIPVPGSTVAVDYEHLLRLEHKGIKRFPPEGLDHEINVKQLLDKVTTAKERSEITESKFTRGLNARSIIANLVILLLGVGLMILFALEVVGGWVFIIAVPMFIYPIINFISTIISIPKLLNAISLIFASPKYLGRFIFDILGKGDKSADFSNIVMGYAIIFVLILILLGIIDLNLLVNIWRFFFPNKP